MIIIMNYEKANNALKEIIDKESILYLIETPERIYPDLIAREIDADDAAILTYALAANGFKKLSKQSDTEGIINILKNEKQINTKTAEELTEALLSILTAEQYREWKEREGEGFREFCSKSWKCSYSAGATFTQGNSQDYYIEGSYEIKVADEALLYEKIKAELKKKPYIKAEAIQHIIETKLQSKIVKDFSYYCTCEPYYPPYVEEYSINLEELINSDLSEIGLIQEKLEFNNNESGWY